MRLPRIHTDQRLHPGTRVNLDERASRHLVQVLRLDLGARLWLFNGDGHDYAGQVAIRAGGRVEVAVGEPSEPEPPLTPRITLALGISKGERMDYALQKAVELGVAALVPLLTRRTVVKLTDERRDQRHRHWRGIVIAACEQSGRRRLPELAPALSLDAWLERPRPFGLLLDPTAERGLDGIDPPAAAELCLLVGPEGGLDPAERAAARRAGLHPVRLGPRILRAETAPLAALAALQMLWGDFRG